MFEIRDTHDPEEKARICNDILRAVPEWFGNEAAITGYTEEVRALPFIAAYADGAAIGFLAIKEHNVFTAEMCVLGVLKQYHRMGVGKAMVTRCEEFCRERDFEFLTVKTLADLTDYPPYARTRAFYLAMGFRPLEVFPLLWDADNPCLFMAKYLK